MLEVVDERSEANRGEVRLKSLPVRYCSVPHAFLNPKFSSFGRAFITQRLRYGLILSFTFWNVKSCKGPNLYQGAWHPILHNAELRRKEMELTDTIQHDHQNSPDQSGKDLKFMNLKMVHHANTGCKRLLKFGGQQTILYLSPPISASNKIRVAYCSILVVVYFGGLHIFLRF
jgi:hypothetical protein